MSRASHWWKCDLQIATPPYNFRTPPDLDGDWSKESNCRAFAEHYVDTICAAGIGLVVIANHNRVDKWINYMQDAATNRLTVLPGVEITSGTGQDGVHLIIFGGHESTIQDFDRLLHGPCGFNNDHPLFDNCGDPMPSPNTVEQLLDQLSDDFLAIAPHALNENGIASARTVKGSIRWKALHHQRLGAVDVGDPAAASGDSDSWNTRFRERRLDNFPCLNWLPFVATSDAYEVDSIGQRFTWIRMSVPSLEGLRQAFLDYDVRVKPVWGTSDSGPRTPNDIRHAWITSVELTGTANSSQDLKLQFDPHFNVLIGGRGSGKSTIVNALLQLYGNAGTLPPATKSDVEQFADSVFGDSIITATHRLAESGMEQGVQWTRADGSRTFRSNDQLTHTDFAATVVSQKELFERSGAPHSDPHSTSRHLLQLVDSWAGLSNLDIGEPASLEDRAAGARDRWAATIERRVRAEDQTRQEDRELITARIADIRAQLELFDAPEVQERRSRHHNADAEGKTYERLMNETRTALHQLQVSLETTLGVWSDSRETLTSNLARVQAEIHSMIGRLGTSVDAAVSDTFSLLSSLDEHERAKDWWKAIEECREDAKSYQDELEERGLDIDSYTRLSDDLSTQESLLREFARRLSRLPTLLDEERHAESEFESRRQERRDRRSQVLEDAQKGGFVRFVTSVESDWSAWVVEIRRQMSLRSDGFVSEVPTLAKWLWSLGSDEREHRIAVWRRSLLSGDFSELAGQTAIRQQFWARMTELDRQTRIRIYTTIPDDVITMSFLREGATPNNDDSWQLVSTGSPGQRSAAMLSLVLAYGDDPLILDQPEDDLDTEWVTQLVVPELRRARWNRQLIVITHNANIPVNGDADRVTVLENTGTALVVRETTDGGSVDGPVEVPAVRRAIQDIMEGGVAAFVARERRYNNELNTYRIAQGLL